MLHYNSKVIVVIHLNQLNLLLLAQPTLLRHGSARDGVSQGKEVLTYYAPAESWYIF
jgi:hypothetical protein